MHDPDANVSLLIEAAERASAYLSMIDARAVAPTAEALSRMDEMGGPLPDHSTSAVEVLRLLDEVGSPATTATTGSRYFGLVIGGALPATLAANWLAAAWDQNVGVRVGSEMGARLEEIVLRWLSDLLRIPNCAGGAFVTGATMGNFTALAAARHSLLARQGWDVEGQGLFGAPELKLVVGEHVHVSVLKAISMLGLGRDRVIRVPADDQGRMIAERLPPLNERTIICIQAGNVNSGAFDPAEAVCAAAADVGAWVHVDGAFGLWAQATEKYSYLCRGLSQADSWATDAHKWLNVPYDSGICFVRDESSMRAAMTATASYLVTSDGREPFHYTPEMSRRSRATEIWAALRSLGRSGISEMIDRSCRQASHMATALARAGYAVLNDVVLNQVLVAFDDDEHTRQTIAAVQNNGTCWCGGTTWGSRFTMRISFSSWRTTMEDVDLSIAAILTAAEESRATVRPV